MAYDLSEEVAKRLRAAREKADLSLSQLGRLIHASKGEIGKIETGKRRLTLEWLVRICKGLGLDHEEFIRALNGTAHHSKNALLHSEPDRQSAEKATLSSKERKQAAKGELFWIPRDLPMRGRVNARGELVISEGGRAVGHTQRPPEVAYDSDAFGTYAPADNSMHPMYKPGQTLIVSSRAALLPGFGVLVICKDGRSFARELVKNSPKGVTVRTYHPKKDYLIKASQIAEMYRIVTVRDAAF